MDMGGGHKKRYTHMTFFWGKNSEILFTGWPATRGGHYALALIVCFLLAVIIEWLSCCRLTRPWWSHTAISLTRTVMYTVRVGLAYLVMLALMSFNGGVFLAIVAGNAVGFALFGCWKKDPGNQAAGGSRDQGSELPPMKC